VAGDRVDHPVDGLNLIQDQLADGVEVERLNSGDDVVGPGDGIRLGDLFDAV